MRIGFDVSQTAERMAGCGIVADQFLRHLVKANPYDTFIPYPVFGNYHHPNFAEATKPRSANVIADQFDMSWEALTTAWSEPGRNFRTFLSEPDVVHVNNYSFPRQIEQPVVYTVYDLSAVEAAQFHTERNRMVCFDGLFEASLSAAHLVAISHHSRARFLHWFPHVKPDRVSVVHLGARESLRTEVPQSDVEQRLRSLGLSPNGFWLAVGTIEPRKNYAALLEAYAQLRDRFPAARIPLCIAGQFGWLESSLEPRIRQLGLEESVRCLGFVDDAVLAALYRGCLGFIYPSRYEGFGLPIVEAMACGAAVIATRSTSMPEVVGDAGWLVDPESANGYVNAMTEVLLDSSHRAEMRAAAVERALQFSWEKGVAILRDVYDAAVAVARSPQRA